MTYHGPCGPSTTDHDNVSDLRRAMHQFDVPLMEIPHGGYETDGFPGIPMTLQRVKETVLALNCQHTFAPLAVREAIRWL